MTTEATTTTSEETPATDPSAPSGEAAGVPPPAVPAVEPAPSAAALMAEKLEALRLRNAERKARNAKYDERAKDLSEREAKVASWKTDARALITATGAPAKDVLDALVQQAHLDGTPEGEIAKMRAEMKAELEGTRAELAALKAEREAEREAARQAAAARTQAEAERAFITGTLVAEKYAPLRALRPDGQAIYSEAELVRLANHYADQLAASGKLDKANPLASVADAMLSEHLAWASRFGPVTTAATPAPEAAGKTVNGGRKPPNTLSNSGSEAAAKRPLSFEERVERAKEKFRA